MSMTNADDLGQSIFSSRKPLPIKTSRKHSNISYTANYDEMKSRTNYYL